MTLRRLSPAGEIHTPTTTYLWPNGGLLLILCDQRHGWLSYLVDEPPTKDKILQTGHRSWELPEHRPMLTMTRGAFKTYST